MAYQSRRGPRAVQSKLRRYFDKTPTFVEDKTDEESCHDFSRNGPLSPRILIVILLYLVADSGRRGYKHLLDEFCDECLDFGLDLPTEQAVSAAAFCKARRRLKPEVYRALLHEVADGFQKTHGLVRAFEVPCSGAKNGRSRGYHLILP